jgi:uncharacterized protein YoxC
MKGQSKLFLILFALTGAGVFWLARQQQPAFAAGAGILGILVHWRLATGNDSDAELADASYFLGFLLTLVLLAAGLSSLANRANAGALYEFLNDLGAGLTITIAGLAIRQVRTLSAPRVEPTEQSLEPLLRELIAAVNRLPEDISKREVAIDPRAAEREVIAAAPRIHASMLQLEDSVSTTVARMTRTASSLGDTLSQAVERVDSQMADVLQLLGKEREAMLAQFEEWRSALGNAHTLLVDGHQTLDTEYRRGLLAVSAAGRSFTQFSNQVAADLKRLPNPAERLEHLWTGVDTLDAKLKDSIGEAGARFVALSQQAQEASVSVDRLSQSLRTASANIERGGGEVSATLERELRDVSKVLDDFVGLLNERVNGIGVA